MPNPFAAQVANALQSSWPAVARPNQLPPPGEWWQIWLLLAGRGFGKTRTLAEWVSHQAASGQASRIAALQSEADKKLSRSAGSLPPFSSCAATGCHARDRP